jgi:hypothetical protein
MIFFVKRRKSWFSSIWLWTFLLTTKVNADNYITIDVNVESPDYKISVFLDSTATNVAGFAVSIQHLSSEQQDLHEFASNIEVNPQFNFSDISSDKTNISGMSISGVQVPENGLLSLFSYEIPLVNGLISTSFEITANEESFFDGDGIPFAVSNFVDINLIYIDTDLDGVEDVSDAFPFDASETLDNDADGIGNNADSDDDNDGVLDDDDTFPFDKSESVDTDSDGVGNNADPDDDNDGVEDTLDVFPLDALETLDNDADGIGNNADSDDDNDGVLDDDDTFPFDTSESVDTDSDGIGNNADPDDDNDGVEDTLDVFPLDASESLDYDADGIGDNADPDDDNDGVEDTLDVFPLDASESLDYDADGIGDNADPDDDNDGVFDTDDGDPLNADIGIHRSQLISVVGNPLVVNGQSIKISLNYDTSDGDNQLLGIGVRVHYSSEILTFAGTENAIANDLYANGDGPYQDESDFDNDLSTDKYIIFGWTSLIGNWPDVSLPASLVDMVFNAELGIIDQTSITTPINFSKVSSTEGYNFGATNYTLTVLAATWDFDGNSEVDALTDGLLLLRYLFDVRGESLTSNIISPNAIMSHSQIALNMESNVVIADIDKDGESDALTDGLLLLRYLFDVRGESLISGVVSSAAERSTEAEIESYIEQYMPKNY